MEKLPSLNQMHFPSVAEVAVSMQHFGWLDYIMFILMLLVCVFVGFYFGFFHKSKNSQDYLMGGRNMKVFPVSMSLIASFISGISLLGIPTEIYVYGIQYVYVMGGVLLMSLVFGTIFLPVFRGLNLTSTYEYHERRFNKKIRMIGSVLFTISLISWLPLVIYVPALAFNQVTGVNVHYTTPILCTICIFYTSMGGLKAVVWTDVIQTVIMFGSMLLVVIKGTLDVGGFQNVIERNWKSGRIEGPIFDSPLTTRHTFLGLVFGIGCYWLQSAAVNQNMIQRYLSLPSLRAGYRALWLFFWGIFVIVAICSYAGMVIYAMFHDCDPVTTKLAKEKDQLLPLLVMKTVGDIPGLPGIFVAGIFSAALSSLSTGLNSMAAIVLEDFYKTLVSKEISEKSSAILMRVSVVLFGALCVGLVFVVEKLGAVLQLSMSLGSIGSGPALGLFTMGMLLPWVNATGALIGSTSGLAFMTWLCFRAQAAIASGNLVFEEKPISTSGCHYHFTPAEFTTPNATNVNHISNVLEIYKMSYLWYSLTGLLVTVTVGLLASLCTKPLNPQDVDPALLSPIVRRFIKPRQYSNQPKEGIIYAYSKEKNTNGIHTKSEETNETKI